MISIKNIFTGLALFMVLYCANVFAQGTGKSPQYGFQLDTSFEDSGTGNPAWTRIRLNELDENGEFLFGDIARYQYRNSPLAGYEEQMGFSLPLEIGAYRGGASIFGVKSVDYDGAGFNFLGDSNNWIIGGMIEGADDRGHDDWLYGLQIGRHFETNSGKAQLIFGAHKLRDVGTGTVFFIHNGPSNWDSGIGYKFNEEGDKSLALSVGQWSPAFQGTTWRLSGTTDFAGNYLAMFQLSKDPHPPYRYFVYGFMNPNDGFTDVSLVDNIMNFPRIWRHNRGREFVFEFLYDRNQAFGDSLHVGTTVYPLKILGNQTSLVRPHLDFEADHHTHHEDYQRYGGGVLFDLTGSGKESTTNLLDIGAFTDSEGTTIGYLQLTFNF
jgi:hypothetical protein